MATLALASYALLAYAMLLALGSTLTLPGLAGFVLAIGMAIDANVLVFERAREEYAAYPSAGLRRALAVGFNKAWSAIIDSNVTTLLAAALLFILGSGPIKGFGVTLSIGVIASMISALVIARVLSELSVSTKAVERRPAVSGLGNIGRVRAWLDRSDFDIMGKRRMWLGISGAALVLAVSGIVTQGLNLGVEFSGGRQLDYSVSEEVTVDEARDAIADAGFGEAVVQGADTADFTVRTGVISNEEEQKIEDALESIGGTSPRRTTRRSAPPSARSSATRPSSPSASPCWPSCSTSRSASSGPSASPPWSRWPTTSSWSSASSRGWRSRSTASSWPPR